MSKIVTDYDQKRQEVATEICDLVASTAGPFGGNVIFFNQGYPKMYRDGKKVLESYDPNDNVALGIKHLMHGAATRTVRAAGDGSTTTTILLTHIYNAAMQEIAKSKSSVSRRAIAQQIRDAGAAAIEALSGAERLALETERGRKLLCDVATLAGGNDPEIGKVVSDVIIAIGIDGYVVTEYSPDVHEISVDYKGGYQMPFGVISKNLLPPGRASITLSDAFVALAKDHISTNEHLLKIIATWQRYCDADNKIYPLVLLCGGIDASAQATLMHRTIQPGSWKMMPQGGMAPWFCIRVSTADAWEDIEAITGVKAPSGREGRGIDYFTAANCTLMPSVVVGAKDSMLEINDASLEKSGIVSRLREMLEGAGDEEKAAIEARIARLEGRVGSIKIPFSSDAKKHWTAEVFEDAYLAAISAVKEGITPGAGKTFYILADHITARQPSTVGSRSVRAAFESVLITILMNGGIPKVGVELAVDYYMNTCDGEFRGRVLPLNNETLSAIRDAHINSVIADYKECGVIDSAAVIKAAIQSATDEAADWIETPNAVTT